MKIKDNLEISTTDFWYDLTDGGYLDPYDICENENDATEVQDALNVLIKFKMACEGQIEDFIQ